MSFFFPFFFFFFSFFCQGSGAAGGHFSSQRQLRGPRRPSLLSRPLRGSFRVFFFSLLAWSLLAVAFHQNEVLEAPQEVLQIAHRSHFRHLCLCITLALLRFFGVVYLRNVAVAASSVVRNGHSNGRNGVADAALFRPRSAASHHVYPADASAHIRPVASGAFCSHTFLEALRWK